MVVLKSLKVERYRYSKIRSSHLKGRASSLAVCDRFASSKQTLRMLLAFESGFDRNKPCKRMSTRTCSLFSSCIKYFTKYLNPRTYVHTIVERSRWCLLNFSGSKVRRRDRDASKQTAKNVPLASADIRGGGRLRDEPNECLRRRLHNGYLRTERSGLLNNQFPGSGQCQKAMFICF